MRRIIIYIIRFVFLGLIFFELLNLFKIFHFTLEFSWFGLILTAAVAWALLEFLNYYSIKKYQYSFPVFIFIIPAFNIFFDAFGDILHWYGKFSWYDQLSHFLGGVAITSLFFFILRGIFFKKGANLSNRFLALVAFLISNFFGVLYELEEYAESLFLHNNRLGDRFDTPNDMFFNMMGALVGVLIVIMIVRTKKKKA